MPAKPLNIDIETGRIRCFKRSKNWSLIGKSVPRLDTKDKLDGSKIYAVDVTLPGMLNAIYIAAPVFGSKIQDFDASLAKTMPGVKDVFTIKAKPKKSDFKEALEYKVVAKGISFAWENIELMIPAK